VVEESVTYVNAPLLARGRGVEVTLTTCADSPDWRNLVTVRGTMADGVTVSVSGTLTGPKHIERLVEVNGYPMEIAPTEHMGFFTYIDRPGIVGVVGRLLGDAGINIAGMQVGRSEKGGKALIALTVDSALTQDLIDAIVEAIGADRGRRVDLDG
jgi:D-3-phosphoglycerate dehydrogenase / 2-oxoglutarate reductase